MNRTNRIRIGYLVPEFPAQTHAFFWREIGALAGLGVDAQTVSTRPPDASLVCHDWARQAAAGTAYLARPGWRQLLGGCVELLRAGPNGWARCLGSIMHARDVSLPGRVKLLAMCVLGGQLAWLARRRGWQHVHVHSCADSANIAMFARLLGHCPYSLTLHGRLVAYGPNQKEKWRHATFVTLVTSALRQQVDEALGPAPASQIELAPMGVDVASFQRTGPYQPYQSPGRAVVFSCGRLNVAKAHDDLFRAVATLRQRGVDVELRIAGADDFGGRCGEELSRLAEQLGLAEHVCLLGAAPEQSVREELDRAHLYASASLTEALPVATMEAMAMSLPVVVTDVGGVDELVTDGVEGRLVQPRHPDQLADAIEAILNDRATASNMARSGRAKIERSFHHGVGAAVLARCLGRDVESSPHTSAA